MGGYSPRFVEDTVHVYTVQSDSRQNRQNRIGIWGGILHALLKRQYTYYGHITDILRTVRTDTYILPSVPYGTIGTPLPIVVLLLPRYNGATPSICM